MKLLVQTKGNYALHDLIGRQTVQAYRPCVVTNNAFIEAHRAGKLEILEELADEATDATLAAARNEEELKAAIADLPRAKSAKRDPLDHDNDGKKGGSLPRAKKAE